MLLALLLAVLYLRDQLALRTFSTRARRGLAMMVLPAATAPVSGTPDGRADRQVIQVICTGQALC